MATTMAMSLPTSPPASPVAPGPHCCPSCGFNLRPQDDDIDGDAALLEAQRTIAQLQAQVRLLNQKNTTAADKLADYEEEIAKLRAASTNSNKNNNMPSPPPSATFQQDRLLPPPSPSRTSFSRISALLTRKSIPNLTPPPPQQQPQLKPLPNAHQSPTATTTTTTTSSRSDIPTTSNEVANDGTASSPSSRPPSQEVANALESAAELAVALAREQSLRRRAEEKFDATHREIDDLSATLFSQANEMVAKERMANAKLEERIAMLDHRDQEKRKRLERLEAAMNRIEKARAVLASQRNSA